MSLFRKKKPKKYDYDREKMRPVIRSSICTGEKVAGFKDMYTGKFTEIMLIRDDRDLVAFKQMYGVDEMKTEY